MVAVYYVPGASASSVDCREVGRRSFDPALTLVCWSHAAGEYHDIKDEQPDDYNRLLERLAAYQATAVDVSYHELPLCDNPSSDVTKPVDGNWMPVCP